MGVRKFFASDSETNSISNEADQNRERSQPAANKQEVAGYIARMSAEMEQMADAARLDVLSYLLAMARQEARRSARRSDFGGAA